jgi:hypothetical protein
MEQQIEIVKTNRLKNWGWAGGYRYARDVIVNGEKRGEYWPTHGNEWTLRDLAERPVRTEYDAREHQAYKDRYIGHLYEAGSIADMEFVVEAALEYGLLLTQAGIDKREAAEQAEKDREAAEDAEDARIWKIKEHGEELLEALERVLKFPNEQSRADAWSVINRARGES